LNALSPLVGRSPLVSMNLPGLAPSTGIPALRTTRPRSVAVQAPGRLHLGFLDPAGTLGRRYGSIGLVIDGFETALEIEGASRDRITVSEAAQASAGMVDAASGCASTGAGAGASTARPMSPQADAEAERAAAFLQVLRQRTGRREALHLRLMQVLPAHAGFGSGTQLALAVGRAFAQWHGLGVSTATLAQWLGRGLRSGVGIAGFDQGGLLVDGGPGADGRPAPLLARVALPDSWHVVVVQDSRHAGLSGAAERQAIATLPPLPRADAAEICHQVLMRVLPGAASGEFAPFAAGITRLQQLLGAHFAPAQQGSAYTSAAVGRMLQWVAAASDKVDAGQGVDVGHDRGAAIGQSSWGPTGFAILPSQARAQQLVEAARAAGAVDPALTVHIVRARNRGAGIAERSGPAAGE
jgi:beta-ribofuranosylaminobenzene 5'-phosphate synthase